MYDREHGKISEERIPTYITVSMKVLVCYSSYPWKFRSVLADDVSNTVWSHCLVPGNGAAVPRKDDCSARSTVRQPCSMLMMGFAWFPYPQFCRLVRYNSAASRKNIVPFIKYHELDVDEIADELER